MKQYLSTLLGSRFPVLAKKLAESYQPQTVIEPIPWTPLSRPLSHCRVALVTTAGVHHHGQKPFDMQDEEGDPGFRALDGATITNDYRITHDYYDHTDAEKDLNVVFPLERLREFHREGVIGELVGTHYGFMGHVTGRHLPVLVEQTAVEVANRLKKDGVDLVLLSPA
ncbi:MAG: hypothetical protein C0618_01445 [Desulfuromonas sp.]|nr:MAG: hypothetical protein C0618_01445 [Desulfuromonas sp.]